MKKFATMFLALTVLSTVAFAGDPVEKECAFGSDILELKKNKRFKHKRLTYTFKLSRKKDPVNPLLWVLITELTDTQTGKIYQMNTTNHDQYDGGNTTGWIEEVTMASEGVEEEQDAKKIKGTGEAVAEISDSNIYACKR